MFPFGFNFAEDLLFLDGIHTIFRENLFLHSLLNSNLKIYSC